MSRFEREGVRRVRARDAVLAVALTALLLLVLSGGSVDEAADGLDSGVGRDLIASLGDPAATIADSLPFAEAQADLTGALSPDAELGAGGFGTVAGGGSGAVEVPAIGPEAFDPLVVGGEAPAREPLETLLVTGDSLSTPLDQELARRLAPDGVEVIRDPHLASGISNSSIVDWGELATSQVEREEPDAVVVFLGANEGYAMPGAGGGEVECCGPEYAALYANRVRLVMNTYRQAGEAKVYWLTVMAPRDEDAREIVRLVDAAIAVAAAPWASQVRVVDTVSLFTPGGEYTDSIEVDGEDTIVRESDGIHLNDVGSRIAADVVIDRIDIDFTR